MSPLPQNNEGTYLDAYVEGDDAGENAFPDSDKPDDLGAAEAIAQWYKDLDAQLGPGSIIPEVG